MLPECRKKVGWRLSTGEGIKERREERGQETGRERAQ